MSNSECKPDLRFSIDEISQSRTDPIARNAAEFILLGLYNNPLPSRKELNELLADMSARTTLAAFDDSGSILSIAALDYGHSSDEGELCDVVTAEELRRSGHGLGKAVVGRVEALARDRGIATLVVYPTKDAVTFYEKKLHYRRERPNGRLVKQLIVAPATLL